MLFFSSSSVETARKKNEQIYIETNKVQIDKKAVKTKNKQETEGRKETGKERKIENNYAYF